MEVTSEISKRMCRLCMNEEDVVLYIINENPGFRNFDMTLSRRIMACLGIEVRTCSHAGAMISNNVVVEHSLSFY
jgi:hypothetical protein